MGLTEFIAENSYLVNSLWVLVAAVFVFLMQAGFACCESGFATTKSTCNIMMKNAADFCVGALVYYFIGFGLMYGNDWHGLIGVTGFFNPLDQDLAIWDGLGLSKEVYLLFQTMFCATTATIISGSVAERFKFNSYLIVSVLMTGLVYPICGHWIWGGGWLSQLGFVDFAGSTAVHSVGAWAALVGAAMVGARHGKYTPDGKVNAKPGHNLALAGLGVFILWFGWYGFNPGSELALDDTTFFTAITTTYAAAAGGLGAMFTSWIKYKKPDVTLALNGCLGGLVAICTGVAGVTYIGSIAIGGLAGIILVFSVEFIDSKLKVDDPVGAISIHGVCGIFGTLAAGLFFCTEDLKGLFYGGGFSMLGTQLIGVLAVGTFVLAVTFLIYFVLKHTLGIRVSLEDELTGVDVAEHGLIAYPEFMGIGIPIPGGGQPVVFERTDMASTGKSDKTELPPVVYQGKDNINRVEIIANRAKFEELKEALNAIGVMGMTVSQVDGCGVQKGRTNYYRGAKVTMNLLPKVKIETVVSNVPVETVVDAARKVLYTGNAGDGKIFVYAIDDVIRVSTGENGTDALQYDGK